MKKLDVLIIRSFIRPFVAAFAIILFILVLQFLSKYIDDIFGKGIDSVTIARVFLFSSMTLVTLALPLAILQASLMTMGNLGETYELAAIKSSGTGLFKLMRPLTTVTIFITIGALVFSFYVIPIANLKLFTLLYDLGKVKPSFALEAGHFYRDIEGLVIHIADKDQDRDMLYKIKIYDHSNEIGNLKVTVADSGLMVPNSDSRYLYMTLFNGSSWEDIPQNRVKEKVYQYKRFYFDTLDFKVDLAGFNLEESDKNTFRPHHYMKNIHELSSAVDSLERRIEDIKIDLGKYINKFLVFEQPKPDTAKGKFPPRPPDPPSSRKGRIGKNLSNLPDSIRKKIELNDSLSKARIAREEAAIPDVDLDTIVQPDTSKLTAEWFPDEKRIEIMNKALHNARAIKNYTVIIKDRMEREELKKRKFSIEYNYRFALPISCLVFLFLGAPLGAIIRKGGLGFPMIFSVLFFIVFYILMIQGRKFARDEILPVWMGVWLPVLVMFPFAILFTWQSATDSRILSMAWYYKNIGRLRKILPGKKKVKEELMDPRTRMVRTILVFEEAEREAEAIEQLKGGGSDPKELAGREARLESLMDKLRYLSDDEEITLKELSETFSFSDAEDKKLLPPEL